MKSIQTKFIILILSCVLLCSVVIGGAGLLTSKEVIDNDSIEIMNLLSNEKSNKLNALLTKIEQPVNMLADYTLEQLESVDRIKNDPDYLTEYTRKLETVAVSAANNTEGAMAVYIRYNPTFTSPTSGLFWSKASLPGKFERLTPTDFSNYDPSDMEHVGWYYVPVKNGKATWMQPYLNKNLNVRMISYVIPLYKNNEVVGVVGMDINLDVINDAVKDIRAYKTGYAFLADNDGKLIDHPDLPINASMTSIDRGLQVVVDQLKYGTNADTLFTYQYQKQEKKMAYRALSNDMNLIISVPTNEIDAAKNQLIKQIVIATILISAIAVIITITMSRHIVRPLRELNNAAQKLVAGDFSVTFTYKSKDEVGTLAESFQHTVNHLHKYIDHINGLAYRDSLTGVKNKTAYQDAIQKLEERMRVGRPEYAVVVFDINGLKHVNDNYGHDFGDMLILDACKLICKNFKHSPIYRIGGDEFVAILEGADFENYHELLEKFQISMNKYSKIAHEENCVSVARGIAIYSYETDLVFADVFKRADEAMYQNKAMMKKQDKKID